MGVKISDGTPKVSLDGTEQVPISGSGNPTATTQQIANLAAGAGWAKSGSTDVTDPTIIGSATFYGRQYFTNDPNNPQFLFSTPTLNSVSPDTPTNYGKFNHVLYDGGSVGIDGRYDAVYRDGWNVAPGGGPEIVTEAMFSRSLENHYYINGSGPYMEHIWESNTGTLHGNHVNRHLYMIVDKITGGGYLQWNVDSTEYFANNAGADPDSYFAVTSEGDMNLYGDAAVFSMGFNDTSLVFSAIDDGTGNVSITNASAGTQKALTITSPRFFINNTAIGGDGALIRSANVAGGFGLLLDVSGTVSGNFNPLYELYDTTGYVRNSIRNTNAGAGAHAELYLQTLGGDPSLIFYDGSSAWVAGLDHSDGGKFKIGTAYGWGSNVWLSISQLGQINLGFLPTSASGLSTGDLWNSSGTLKVA